MCCINVGGHDIAAGIEWRKQDLAAHPEDENNERGKTKGRSVDCKDEQKTGELLVLLDYCGAMNESTGDRGTWNSGTVKVFSSPRGNILDPISREWYISKLNGYVMAMSSIDGNLGDSIASAYSSNLDEDKLIEGLNAHLNQEPQPRYTYDSLLEIRSPWTRQLVAVLDSFFFRRPFQVEYLKEHERTKSTREGMVTRVENLIGLITDDYSCSKIFRVCVTSKDGYVGYMHLFPLGETFLVLKTVSR